MTYAKEFTACKIPTCVRLCVDLFIGGSLIFRVRHPLNNMGIYCAPWLALRERIHCLQNSHVRARFQIVNKFVISNRTPTVVPYGWTYAKEFYCLQNSHVRALLMNG